MKVVSASGIYGDIKNAILSAESAIARIEVTQAEMDEFVSNPEFHLNVDKNYGSFEIQVPLGVKTHPTSNKVKSCWYLKTFITVV